MTHGMYLNDQGREMNGAYHPRITRQIACQRIYGGLQQDCNGAKSQCSRKDCSKLRQSPEQLTGYKNHNRFVEVCQTKRKRIHGVPHAALRRRKWQEQGAALYPAEVSRVVAAVMVAV